MYIFVCGLVLQTVQMRLCYRIIVVIIIVKQREAKTTESC